MIDLMRHGQWLPIRVIKRTGKSHSLIITCTLLCSLGIFSDSVFAQLLSPESEPISVVPANQAIPPTKNQTLQQDNIDLVNTPEEPPKESTKEPNNYLFQNTKNPTLQSVFNKLEKWQANMGQYVDDSGERIDRFFGDNQAQITRKGSQLDILLPTTLYDNGKVTTGLNFRAKIDLPRTNYRWNIVLTSFADSLYNDQSGQTIPNDLDAASRAISGEEDSTTSLAARYMLFTEENAFTHIDFGLKFTDFIDPNPYGRFRTRYKANLSDKLLSRTTHDFYLERSRGGAIETKQVFDYQQQPKNLFRSQTSGVWWHKRGDYLLNQKGIWYKTFNPHRVNAYYVSGNWLIDNEGATFTDVSVGLNWREKLYKEWLFGEIEPKAIWREEDHFQTPDLSLTLQLEMRFYPPK